MRDHKEEGLFLLVLDETNGLGGQGAHPLGISPQLLHCRTAIPFSENVEMLEALFVGIKGRILANVPLAVVARDIPCLGERLGDRHFLEGQHMAGEGFEVLSVAVRPFHRFGDLVESAIRIVESADDIGECRSSRRLARQERAAGWAAQRTRRIGSVEYHPGFGDPVEVRSLVVEAARDAEILPPEVVHQNKHEIRRTARAVRAARIRRLPCPLSRNRGGGQGHEQGQRLLSDHRHQLPCVCYCNFLRRPGSI